MDVLILAGGKCPDDLAAATGVAYRADLAFGGRTCLEIVSDAVAPAGDPILVSESPRDGFRHAPAGESFIGSLSNGLKAVQTKSFLLSTVDIPCLTSEAVRDYLDRCDRQAALNYPIISHADCEREFPGMPRTTLALKEGVFTGGNMALMRTDLMRQALPMMEEAYRLRKSPLRLAKLLGFSTLALLLAGKLSPRLLTIPKLESAVSRSLGVPVRAVQTPFASIGADVDSLDQYQAMQKLF